MAKKIKSFYLRFFMGLLIMPLCKLIGIQPAMAATSQCLSGSVSCVKGSVQYIGCGTNQLLKQVCQTCEGMVITPGGWDAVCSCVENERETPFTGTQWVDSGSCTTYTNECSYVGQTKAGGSCESTWGYGSFNYYCKEIKVGTKTFLMWNAGYCSLTSCKKPGDIAHGGSCWCSVPCGDSTYGYGTMITALRQAETCPQTPSSSSSSEA